MPVHIGSISRNEKREEEHKHKSKRKSTIRCSPIRQPWVEKRKLTALQGRKRTSGKGRKPDQDARTQKKERKAKKISGRFRWEWEEKEKGNRSPTKHKKRTNPEGLGVAGASLVQAVGKRRKKGRGGKKGSTSGPGTFRRRPLKRGRDGQ